jgi:LCP family protein required for cell wall assembly
MADDPKGPRRPPEGEERPDYTLYRSGSRRAGRPRDRDAADRRATRGDGADGADRTGRPQYTLYRSRPNFLDRFGRGRGGGLDRIKALRREEPERGGTRITVKRVLLAVLALVAGWLALSLVVFMVSAEVQRGKVSSAAREQLDSGGNLLLSGNTILVLGSDARAPGSLEPGANKVGQTSRSDSILLLRVGGGKSARLSIPRDTIVNIPGAGPNKINAAYAIGGPQLAIRTVKQYLGIEVNHLVEVDFENFPEFIDALGGIDFTAKGCIRSNVDGGTRNGGVTIRFKRGQTKHLNGKQALAVSRIRVNACNPSENDINRAERQQQVLSAIKSKTLSPSTFFRLPWVSWTAPKAIRTDMGGPSLMALFVDLQLGGSPPPRVLKPSGFQTLPDGGQGLVVSEQEKQAEVKRFLKG